MGGRGWGPTSGLQALLRCALGLIVSREARAGCRRGEGGLHLGPDLACTPQGVLPSWAPHPARRGSHKLQGGWRGRVFQAGPRLRRPPPARPPARRCFTEPVNIQIGEEDTFSRSSSACSEWGSTHYRSMSSSMLRSRSSSLLPITNQPIKSPPSFSGGRRHPRSKGCYRCGRARRA